MIRNIVLSDRKIPIAIAGCRGILKNYSDSTERYANQLELVRN
jgi:hypothetical protein